jgi:adenylyl cyclase-associated protein
LSPVALFAHLQQPDTAQLQSVLAPVAEPMMAASTLADNRRSACFQQNKVAAEGLQALTWLAYTGPSCGECCAVVSLINERITMVLLCSDKVAAEVLQALTCWRTQALAAVSAAWLLL